MAVQQPELARLHILRHVLQSLPYALLLSSSEHIQRLLEPERQSLASEACQSRKRSTAEVSK